MQCSMCQQFAAIHRSCCAYTSWLATRIRPRFTINTYLATGERPDVKAAGFRLPRASVLQRRTIQVLDLHHLNLHLSSHVALTAEHPLTPDNSVKAAEAEARSVP